MNDREDTGLSEDEVWDSLEELYRRGDINHVPGIGSDVEPAFRLNEQGMDNARELLRENVDALAMLMQQAVEHADEGEEAAAMVKFAKMIRDDVGVNVWRRLAEHPHADKIGVDFEGLPEKFYRQFDPEDDD